MTVERRTVIRWLGSSAALVLGGDLLAACMGKHGEGVSPKDAGAGRDGRDMAGEAAASPGFVFQPGPEDGAIYDNWKQNTVDPQGLEDIAAGWKLTVDGMVKSPRVMSFADIIALPRQDQVTDFHCVEGWSVDDVPWNGVSLAHLLDLVGVDAAATHLTFYTYGEMYKESLPLSVAREPRTLLAYGVGGSTLPLAHGFPLRLVVPRLLGYKNVKHVVRIEATDHPVDGFWENYGYAYDGEVPEERLRPGKY